MNRFNLVQWLFTVTCGIALLFLMTSIRHSGSVASVLFDITNPNEAVSDSIDLPRSIRVDGSMQKEQRVRIGVIKDTEGGHIEEYVQERYNPILTTPFEWRSEAEVFNQKVEDHINQLKNHPRGKPYSSIYTRINGEVKELCKYDRFTKEIHVYSDLQENTEQIVLSSMSSQSLRELQKPHFCLGLTIYLYNKSKTRKQDLIFQKLSTIYQEVYEPHGISIEVVYSTSLSN